MDRFIGCEEQIFIQCCSDLKSNMDRFIAILNSELQQWDV